MNKLFIIDVREITDDLFNEYFDKLSFFKDKILSYKQKEDQLLCLGARMLEHKYIKEDIYISSSGKPLTKNVHYNISHCFPYVAIFISPKNEVGVDIEKNKVLDEKIINKCFTKNELTNGDPIKIWTIKEAFLKYLGSGITCDLNKISLDISKTKVRFTENYVYYKTYLINNYYLSVISSSRILIYKPRMVKIDKIF